MDVDLQFKLDFIRDLEEYARELRGSRAVMFFWERHSFFGYDSICSYALYLAWSGGVRLPFFIHSRILFGPVNSSVREYVANFGV